MSLSLFISHLIGGSVGSTVLLMSSIILGSLFVEDLTAVIVGILAADGIISIPLALFSLCTGVILSDIGFYWLGRLASTHPRLARYVDHNLIAPFRLWLENRYALTIFSTTFIPGSRFPTYTASGFFRRPFSTFILTAISAVIIWMSFLFFIAYWFGAFTSEWIGPARWGIAGIFILILLSIGLYNFFRAYRANAKKKNCAN
jgi:membrane protein DedA with SNARE-associated domain